MALEGTQEQVSVKKKKKKRRAELYQAIHCSGEKIEMKLRNHQSKMKKIWKHQNLNNYYSEEVDP